jgi:hypothetical protein
MKRAGFTQEQIVAVLKEDEEPPIAEPATLIGEFGQPAAKLPVPRAGRTDTGPSSDPSRRSSRPARSNRPMTVPQRCDGFALHGGP